MKELNKERIIWIDYAKAIAMFFVIFGHVDSGNYLTNWIYYFCMPLFSLLYVGYSLLYLLYDLMQVVLLHKDINLIKALIGIFVQLRGTEYTVGLWFLPLLFITEILVYLIAVQNKKTQIVIMILIALIGFSYASIFKQVLPWGIDAVPIATIFVCYLPNWKFKKI